MCEAGFKQEGHFRRRIEKSS